MLVVLVVLVVLATKVELAVIVVLTVLLEVVAFVVEFSKLSGTRMIADWNCRIKIARRIILNMMM